MGMMYLIYMIGSRCDYIGRTRMQPLRHKKERQNRPKPPRELRRSGWRTARQCAVTWYIKTNKTNNNKTYATR